ncbi:MAG: tol-pal system protein YbgF [Dongiaceae bacterium]
MATVLVALLVGVPAGRSAVAQDSNAIAASQEIRIQQLENEIRSLTGLVEGLTYQVQQLSGRVDKLVADADYRLRVLEGTGAAPAIAGAPSSATSSVQAAVVPATAATALPSDQPALLGDTAVVTGGSDADQSVGVSGQVGQPKTLGTLSQSQYEQQSATLGAPPEPLAGEFDGQSQTQLSATTQSYELPGATPDEQYQYAFGLLRQAKYADAEVALRAFMRQNPQHPLAGNANYWLGETYYVRSDYNQAALIFANGYQSYPKSGKAPDTLLKLGMSLAAMGQANDACVAFAELETRYPGASDTVKQRLSQERGRNGC